MLGEPEGPEQAWRQRRRRRERDQASRSSAGQEPKGRTASTPAGLGRQPTPLAAQRLRRRRPGAPLSSSVKFLKAARDSEEARKVQGRTDGCLCLPPRPPTGLLSCCCLRQLLFAAPLHPPSPPPSAQPARPSLQRGNSLWLRAGELRVSETDLGSQTPAESLQHLSQNLAARELGPRVPLTPSPPSPACTLRHFVGPKIKG